MSNTAPQKIGTFLIEGSYQTDKHYLFGCVALPYAPKVHIGFHGQNTVVGTEGETVIMEYYYEYTDGDPEPDAPIVSYAIPPVLLPPTENGILKPDFLSIANRNNPDIDRMKGAVNKGTATRLDEPLPSNPNALYYARNKAFKFKPTDTAADDIFMFFIAVTTDFSRTLSYQQNSQTMDLYLGDPSASGSENYASVVLAKVDPTQQINNAVLSGVLAPVENYNTAVDFYPWGTTQTGESSV